MSILPFDKRDGFIWMDGALVPWRDAQLHVLSHGLHYGSAVFEGERAYGGRIFKSREHSERFRASAELLDVELPYSVDAIMAAKQAVLEANGAGDVYVRPVAWRGSEMMAVAAPNATVHVAHRGLGLAQHVRRRPEDERHPHRHGGVSPARSRHRAGPCEGGRPLHDLHDLEAPGRAPRLRRCPHARLAGPRRRMHGRQRLLRAGRDAAHADRRLFPRRHHPPHDRRPRPEARHRGGGAPDPAGGARRASTNASSAARAPR